VGVLVVLIGVAVLLANLSSVGFAGGTVLDVTKVQAGVLATLSDPASGYGASDHLVCPPTSEDGPWGVRRLLAAHPGALYLRTDQTCPSLRAATEDGNPIYAVYRLGGRTEAQVCAAVRRSGGDAYGKWLNSTTDPEERITC
jgi:hypothetical protein